MTEQRYAGGGIVRELLEGVAKEAPELSRGVRAATRRATINVGLDINGGEKLSPDEVLAALQSFGVKPVRAAVHQSDSEPTLVIELDRSLNAQEAHKLSMDLRQEAIAQVDENGVGDLHGPAADNWKPFNGDYFLDADGKRLSQAIMDAGEGEKPGFAGGGIIREAVEGLLKAAGRNADEAADLAKPMRLYHGTEAEDTIDALDPFVRHDQLGVHLGDPDTASQFARVGNHVQHWKNRRPDEAGARVIPLDVNMKNPLRLMDNKGSWAPHEVYKQMADRGLVPWDEEKFKSLKYRSEGWVQEEDGSWGDYGDQMSMFDAQSEIQDMIRELGHDGVVYLNRYEFPHPSVKSRAEGKPRSYLNSMTDEQFRAEFPEAVDSYIAFRKDQLKSPFGDGPGVGFAGGGVVRKLGQGLVDMLDFSGVGKPRTVKIPGMGEHAALPIGEIDDAAEAYMRKAGIPGTHRINEYPELDPDFSRRIADQYDVLTHAPNDPEVARTYEALLEETMDQYRALKDTGLDIRFLKDGMDDPYALSPSMGYADMVNNGRLWVFPTSQGYGSGADVLEHPLLKKVGKVGDLEDATANDAFRVVHDAYGHFGPGNPFFRAAGEDRAWMHHARMYSDDALPAMSAETRGQNSWVNFGPKARENKGASGASTIYADQKAVAMPRWVYEKDLGRIPKFADGGPVWSEDDADIKAYEDLRDFVGTQSPDIQSMTHIGAPPRRPVSFETFGTEIGLGDAPYYVADDMSTAAQLTNDAARMGIYAVPGAGPFIGAGLDAAEAIATDDPLSAGMAVAFGPGGKLAKGAMTGTMAMGMDPAEAEAGLYGVLSKWGKSAEGRRALDEAQRMMDQGFSMREIRDRTKWELDADGHWKFWLPSKGGGFNLDAKTPRYVQDVISDPHLFDQYSDFRDIRYRRKNDEGAHWDEGRNEIVLGDTSNPGYNTPDAGGKYGAMLHELYHAKSSAEGWPQGTSVFGGLSQTADDIRRLNNIPIGGPIGGPDDPFTKVIGGAENFSPLGFKRYQAEMGEALARREAAMREMDYDNFGPYTVADQIFIDMPKEVLFQPGQPPMMETYNALLKMIDDERVAADMQKAAAAKPKSKGRR